MRPSGKRMDVDCEGVPPASDARPLIYVFAFTALVFLAEIGAGLWSGSLALLADAAHMGVDLAALGIGLFAAWASRLPPDRRRTFGYRRVEVLAALANGLLLWVAVGAILREAMERFHSPTPVAHLPMMLGVAVLGLVCNLVSGMLLVHEEHEHNLNVRAVFLHVMSDALGSVGAIVAGLLMWVCGWWLADPLASVFICVIILVVSVNLVRQAVHILLEGVPDHLDPECIRRTLESVEGVAEVHDLHLWSLSSGAVSMSGHVVLRPGGDAHKVLRAGMDVLAKDFELKHVTLQVEPPKP
jgi:cobalt-zinc-cadmium efflux system protein